VSELLAAAPRREPGKPRGRIALFATIAVVVVVVDQLTKSWVDASFGLSRSATPTGATLVPPTEVVGTLVRISKGYNDGAIFGLFGSSATAFAIASLAVIALIVWYELTHAARGPLLLSIALGFLAGGATGNLIDRVRLGHVIDFVDMGMGTTRWYVFNVADASISTSIVLLLLISVFLDRLAGPATAQPTTSGNGTAP
jgi:signal peptidase II